MEPIKRNGLTMWKIYYKWWDKYQWKYREFLGTKNEFQIELWAITGEIPAGKHEIIVKRHASKEEISELERLEQIERAWNLYSQLKDLKKENTGLLRGKTAKKQPKSTKETN